MADIVQVAALGVGALVCIGGIIIVGLIVFLMLKQKGPLRGDMATPANAPAQYIEFTNAIAKAGKKLKLKEENALPADYNSLSLQLVGKTKGMRLLSGKVKGREVSVDVVLAGNSYATQINGVCNEKLPLDVLPKQGAAVPGLGMDLIFMGGKQFEKGELLFRPEYAAQQAETEKAVTDKFAKKLESLLLLKPKVMNLSSQIGEFYFKKFSVRKGKAYVRDYGLPRDAAYLEELITGFADVCSQWEK